MALVAYDNSDASDYEDGENATTLVSIDLPKPETQQNESTESDLEQSLFNKLPQPSNKKKEVVEDDDEFLLKKESPSDVKPKSKITIPSLKDFKDVENTITNTKSRVQNGKKSGLLSILPQPKNALKSTTKSLIPSAVTQKPKTTTTEKKEPLLSLAKRGKIETKSSLVTEYSDESDNEDIQNDFFSFNKPVELPTEDLPLVVSDEHVVETKNEPRSIESYFKKDVDHLELQQDDLQPSNSADYYSLNTEERVPENSSHEMMLDDEAIIKLCGARAKRKREEIQIVHVNQQEVLGDAREWLLKGLMDDTTKRQSASKKRGNEPTSQQRRKHQITYLAHQAKANEAELQNQWANNRMTRRQTQSKYGF